MTYIVWIYPPVALACSPSLLFMSTLFRKSSPEKVCMHQKSYNYSRFFHPSFCFVFSNQQYPCEIIICCQRKMQWFIQTPQLPRPQKFWNWLLDPQPLEKLYFYFGSFFLDSLEIVIFQEKLNSRNEKSLKFSSSLFFSKYFIVHNVLWLSNLVFY